MDYLHDVIISALLTQYQYFLLNATIVIIGISQLPWSQQSEIINVLKTQFLALYYYLKWKIISVKVFSLVASWLNFLDPFVL